MERWIKENMKGCSCLILFCGEKTYQSKWVQYELNLAREEKMGRFIIYLEGLKNNDGHICGKGTDPYSYHGMYSNSGNRYIIKSYSWLKDDGLNNIKDWIEDAIKRVNQ